VLVSSTFQDLQAERQEVIHAVLELDCIPSGMELFPAADEDQWTLIKKVINDCDYYIVIIAGRYGRLGPAGIGYTEMEYRYAVESGKPAIAFLHKDPESLESKRTEKDDTKRKQLDEFQNLAQKKVCKHWTSPAELGSVVSRSVIRLMKNTPAVGWIRADEAADATSSKEILRLRHRIEELEAEIQSIASHPPEGSEAFAQGTDTVSIQIGFDSSAPGYDFRSTKHYSTVELSWNEIFRTVAPVIIHEATDEQIAEQLSARCSREFVLQHDQEPFAGKELKRFTVSAKDFQTIKVQLRTLGLITKSDKPRSVKDTAPYWTLTPFGDSQMTKIRAIRRDSPDSAS